MEPDSQEARLKEMWYYPSAYWGKETQIQKSKNKARTIKYPGLLWEMMLHWTMGGNIRSGIIVPIEQEKNIC